MRSKQRREVPADSNTHRQQETEDHYLPPRKVIHSSENGKWTRIFYQTVLWLFVLLVIGLTIWGISYK
jgi:hypothetical protein